MTSRASELARAEADAAEAVEEEGQEGTADDGANDGDDAGQTDGAGTAKEPAAPAAITEAEAEAIFSSLERQKASNSREVQKRAKSMWDDLVPCPCCSTAGPVAGFIFPVLPEPAQTMRRQSVALALGAEAPVEYLPDPDTETCERCQGKGMMTTGSDVEGQKVRVCTGCNSQGWRLKTALVQPPPAMPQPVPNLVAVPPANGTVPVTDPWGRTLGHPHFGMSPELVR